MVKHENSWNTFQQERTMREKDSLSRIATMLKDRTGESTVAKHLKVPTTEEKNHNREILNAAYYDEQIKILQDLSGDQLPL